MSICLFVKELYPFSIDKKRTCRYYASETLAYRGIVFEVNGQYENRKGKYTVLNFSGRKMRVRFVDGSEADLNVGIQERIWENILAEQEAAAAAAAKKAGKRRPKSTVTFYHYIKTVSISEDNDLSILSLKQRQALARQDQKLQRGDRLLYFAVEPQLFFAVATITADPKKAKAKDYLYSDNPKEKIHLYPIDVDAHIENAEFAIAGDTTELESMPDHLSKLSQPNQFFRINEDDFELLSEMIMEFGEIEEVDDDETDDGEGTDIDDDLDLDLSV